MYKRQVKKKTDLIGLVVPAIENEFMSQLAYYAEMSARSHGYNIMLCDSGPDLRQEINVVKLLLGRQVDGIPVSYTHLGSLEPGSLVLFFENGSAQQQRSSATRQSRSGRLVMIPSAPRAIISRISASSLTVQVWISSPRS